jgi:diguanylate cyclase (GGDEF)-like protein/PAS domain S-box-containing protein
MQKNKNILLVEDSHFIAMVLGEFLKKKGYTCENVMTGEESVERACRSDHPDLILMDIELAGKMNGIEAATAIIQHKEIPIIFLTANASSKVIDKIRNVNAYGFIEKGMDNTALLATIEMALKLHAIKEEIKEKESILNAVINSVRDALIMIDNLGRVILWNPSAELLFGYSKEEMLGKDFYMLIVEDEPNCDAYKISPDKKITENYEKVKELKARHKDGREIDVEVSISSLNIKDCNYFVGLVRDISERIKSRKALEKMSLTDFLTNTYNRRYFIKKLDEEIERANRTGRTFSLAMLDIDRFKAINDRYGHIVGDQVLKSVADMIKNRIRSIDCLARWGGEEFMILLVDTPIDGAKVLLEELRHGISKINIPGVDSFTGSFGVVGFTPGDTADSMVLKADNMMYQAKSAGRNCIKYMRNTIDKTRWG